MTDAERDELIWWPIFKSPYNRPEFDFMQRFYSDVPAMVAAAETTDPSKHYRFSFEFLETPVIQMRLISGRYCEVRNYCPPPEQLGMVQRISNEAAGQLNRIGEEVFHDRYESLKMVPPCNIGNNLGGTNCRVMWGRELSHRQTMTDFSDFSISMDGREFIISCTDEPRDPPIQYLEVRLCKGKPLNGPRWGRQLSLGYSDIALDQGGHRDPKSAA